MRASIVDLRYKMPRVLKALRLREPVTLLYHGKEQGILHPVHPATARRLADSPVFGMWQNEKRPTKKIMNSLRAPRFRAH